MNKRLIAVLIAGVFSAGSTAGAQSPNCPSGAALSRQTATQDACQQTYDLFTYLAPQLGAAIVGGNTTLGQGGTLGGLPNFTIEARGNVVWAQVPNVSKFPSPAITGAQSRQLPTTSTFLPMVTADGAVGLFKGVPLGVTNVGGVDVLVSASYIPDVTTNNVSVTPKTKFQFGFGGRLGIISEGLLTPGVSVSLLERNLPTTDIVGTQGTTTLAVNGASINTTAIRLVASKSLLLFGLAVGIGQDSYAQKATVTATSGAQSSDPISFDQTMKRTNMFADVSMNFIVFKLVGEIGRVTGGTATTFNTFSGGPANTGRTYGTAGVRFTF